MESADSDQKEKIYNVSSLRYFTESQKSIILDKGVEDVKYSFI